MHVGGFVSAGQSHKDNAVVGQLVTVCTHKAAGHLGQFYPPHTRYALAFLCTGVGGVFPNTKAS